MKIEWIFLTKTDYLDLYHMTKIAFNILNSLEMPKEAWEAIYLTNGWIMQVGQQAKMFKATPVITKCLQILQIEMVKFYIIL